MALTKIESYGNYLISNSKIELPFINSIAGIDIMETKKLSRKERETEQRKAYILEQAEILFAEHGFENTSIAMIAERSEFSVGTVYNFFPSKNDIYSELVITKMSHALNVVTGIANEDINPLEKLKKIISSQLSMMQQNKKFIKIYIDDLTRLEWDMRSNLKEKDTKVFTRIHETVGNIIRDAQNEGFIRKDIHFEKISLIFQKMSKIYILFNILEEHRDLNEIVDEMFEILMNGIGAKK